MAYKILSKIIFLRGDGKEIQNVFFVVILKLLIISSYIVLWLHVYDFGFVKIIIVLLLVT
jgi:hypothetical protein